ncbi:MAG: dihydroorotate dehydrogenase [Promethearchaeota archaeon]
MVLEVLKSNEEHSDNNIKDIDLSIELCGVKLRNPVILASGILGANGEILKRVAKSGVGAVTTKSIGPKDRVGYASPCVYVVSEEVILNAMGLPNPGYKYFIEHELDIAREGGEPVIVSIFGKTVDEFVEVAKAMEDTKVKLIEINVSCPHPSERRLIGQDQKKFGEVISHVRDEIKKSKIIVKLSPNVTNIQEYARIAIECKADAISAINTIQALEVDAELEVPILGNLVGGQSGPSIRCIAQRKIADILLFMKKYPEMKRPVIGIGGIASGLDIAKFILLGATCVQVGSGIRQEKIEIFFKRLINELKEFMQQKNYKKLSDFRGRTLNILFKYLEH